MDGRTAFVTGGASGLGRAAAVELASRGINVVIADRKVAEAEETARECRAREVLATAVEFNQSKPESVAACVARAVEVHGRIDLLFANAGVGRFRSFLEMSPQEWAFLPSLAFTRLRSTEPSELDVR